MKKCWLLFLLIIALTPNAFAATKSICELPFGPNGSVYIHYDVRFFDPETIEASYANAHGGMKFTLELGFFTTTTARDDAAALIQKVEYINTTTGANYSLTRADKYSITNSSGTTHMADYIVWIGSGSQYIVGEWQVIVTTKKAKYIGDFSIQQELMDRHAVEPVEIISVTPNIDGTFNLTFTDTNANVYRIRGFDGPNIAWDITVYPPSDPTVTTIISEIPALPGIARVEARINNTWISSGGAFGTPCSSTFVQETNGRAITWFKYPSN